MSAAPGVLTPATHPKPLSVVGERHCTRFGRVRRL
jgi:hypothetical protein